MSPGSAVVVPAVAGAPGVSVGCPILPPAVLEEMARGARSQRGVTRCHICRAACVARDEGREGLGLGQSMSAWRHGPALASTPSPSPSPSQAGPAHAASPRNPPQSDPHYPFQEVPSLPACPPQALGPAWGWVRGMSQLSRGPRPHQSTSGQAQADMWRPRPRPRQPGMWGRGLVGSWGRGADHCGREWELV